MSWLRSEFVQVSEGRKGGRAEAAFRVSKPQGDEVVLGVQWYFSSECEYKRMGRLYAETKEHRRQCQDGDNVRIETKAIEKERSRSGQLRLVQFQP